MHSRSCGVEELVGRDLVSEADADVEDVVKDAVVLACDGGVANVCHFLIAAAHCSW